jgi:hypothetical protein
MPKLLVRRLETQVLRSIDLRFARSLHADCPAAIAKLRPSSRIAVRRASTGDSLRVPGLASQAEVIRTEFSDRDAFLVRSTMRQTQIDGELL